MMHDARLFHLELMSLLCVSSDFDYNEGSNPSGSDDFHRTKCVVPGFLSCPRPADTVLQTKKFEIPANSMFLDVVSIARVLVNLFKQYWGKYM